MFFFFQAEDGIRDIGVTGVQTCALPISQRGQQKVLDIAGEYRGVGAPFHVRRGDHPRKARPGEQGGHRPRVARPPPAGPVAPPSPSAAAGHRGVRAALIDEHQLGRINRRHLGAPRGARGLVALGGAQAFPFNGRPGRRARPDGVTACAGSSTGKVDSDRDIVAVDTTTPVCSAKAEACSASVASAAASSRAASHACTRAFFSGLGPCRCTDGAKLPVVRRRARYRSTLRTDTSNRAATWAGLIPASTAATTRSRRSIEYARMHQAYSDKQEARRCQGALWLTVLLVASGAGVRFS